MNMNAKIAYATARKALITRFADALIAHHEAESTLIDEMWADLHDGIEKWIKASPEKYLDTRAYPWDGRYSSSTPPWFLYDGHGHREDGPTVIDEDSRQGIKAERVMGLITAALLLKNKPAKMRVARPVPLDSGRKWSASITEKIKAHAAGYGALVNAMREEHSALLSLLRSNARRDVLKLRAEVPEIAQFLPPEAYAAPVPMVIDNRGLSDLLKRPPKIEQPKTGPTPGQIERQKRRAARA